VRFEGFWRGTPPRPSEQWERLQGFVEPLSRSEGSWVRRFRHGFVDKK
jgi:hypothetical protein